MKKINHNILVFYCGVGGLFATICMVGFNKHSKIFYDPNEVNWGQVILIVFMDILALWTSMVSFQKVPPTVVAILISQQIVISFVIQCVFNHTLPFTVSIIGALIIMLCAIVIPFEDMFLSKLPPQVAKFFWFLYLLKYNSAQDFFRSMGQ